MKYAIYKFYMLVYTKICKSQICIYMQDQICRKYAQYAQMKYAIYKFYMLVCTKICKSQICIYMQISICIYVQKYVEICKTEYAKICISKIRIIG